jgi:hypothetical protein
MVVIKTVIIRLSMGSSFACGAHPPWFLDWRKSLFRRTPIEVYDQDLVEVCDQDLVRRVNGAFEILLLLTCSCGNQRHTVVISHHVDDGGVAG